MIYDIIIIGGGISGLYMAYKLKKYNPNINLLILEKNKKSEIGGRMGTYLFQGANVSIGAGVGRKSKDYLLIKLLNELKISYHEYVTNIHYAPTIKNSPCNVRSTIADLQHKYSNSKNKYKGKSFSEFAKSILGIEKYQNFTTCSGYTDYENADIHDIIYDYGFEDNYSNWKGLSIPWSELVQELCTRIGMKHIHTSCDVQKIQKDEVDNFILTTKSGFQYKSQNVVIATTIDSVLHLVPEKSKNLYQQISGQPFLRIYGRFSKASTQIMENYVATQTIVPGPIHKIIPIQPERGIYMIVYSDNEGAILLQKYGENIPENRDILCRILERSLGIKENALKLLAIKSFYWPIGTHYYKPLPVSSPFKTRQSYITAAQQPMDKMFIVGEMISINQGWVQGALESVENIFPKVVKMI